MRRAIQDYKMISDEDRIFVGLSGGKDSVLLLSALAAYRTFSPEKFTLEAITVDMGFKDAPKEENEALTAYCDTLGVTRHIVKTDIAEIVFDARKESNPCSLCAKFRRGALNSEINRLGNHAHVPAVRRAFLLLLPHRVYGQKRRHADTPVHLH